MAKPKVDFTIRIAGEGGEGVISCGELFAKSIARTSFHVFTFITYPSEMRGGYSMIQIRFRDITVYSMGSFVDCLVVFNQEAYDRSIEVLKEDGILIYDPGTVKIDEQLHSRSYAVPIEKISKDALGKALGKNVVALGILSHMYGLDREQTKMLVKERYASKGESVVEGNYHVLEKGIHTAAELAIPRKFSLDESKPVDEAYMFISGNQAVALGAIAAGCRFTAGYPLTPATSIFETLSKLLPLVGGRAIQMEDEIAAISAIIGASFGGAKVITPTSGPGIQLMAEQLSLASMLEVPLVVVDVQRGGPSTGLPTKTEQGDLKFAVYGSAGESPRIILAPTSVEDTFYQTIRAFNLAEKYQLPVILLTDQSIGYRKATVKMPAFDKIFQVDTFDRKKKIKIPRADLIDILQRQEPTQEELVHYKRYKDTKNGISPIARPGTPGGQYVATGLEHNEYGRTDQSPANHLKMSKKRFRKLDTVSRAFEKNPMETYGDPADKIGIIGWGSTEGAIREARYLAEGHGVRIRHLHPRTISPLPVRQISNFLHRLDYLIVVEENLTGQFAHFIKAKFGVTPIEVHKCEGTPFTPHEIYNAIMKVARIADEDSITKL